MTVAALIVAAGRSSRFGGDIPKPYRPLAGESVLRRALRPFLEHSRVTRCLVVIDPGHEALCAAALRGLAMEPPVAGGENRQASVLNGLERLAESGTPDAVLVHDAARPLLDGPVIDRCLAALADHDGAVAGVPVADSIKRADADGRVVDSVPREGLWRAQTPQAFRFGPFLAAHRAAANAGLSDDAAVAQAAGLRVSLVAGSEANLKLTLPGDLAMAERLLCGAAAETRVGQGWDVHRFGPGDGVRICGVRIAHHAGLVGHSDADVGLHAATDALLGALAEGDIGLHFPPGDARWKDADSAMFLRFAAERVQARQGRILHLDLTILCEAPKLAPHRAAMQARLSELLALPPERVSIKATTTERLGFIGRGEGIAAQAVATLALPP